MLTGKNALIFSENVLKKNIDQFFCQVLSEFCRVRDECSEARMPEMGTRHFSDF